MSSANNPRIAALIMAAGEGKRFGGCKQLAPFGDSTVLQHTVDTANRHLRGDVYVVCGSYREAIEQQIRHARFIHNPDWKMGLGNSIARGVRALQHDYDAILVMLADQVGVKGRHIAQMLQSYLNCKAIVCAHYHGSKGVPALFPQRYYPSLMQLSGDQGAKQLLNNKSETATQTVSIPEAQIDIDRKADLINFQADS